MPYKVYVQQWYNTYKKDRLSASSKRNYANAINKHILPFIGDRQLRAVSGMDLQDLVNRLSGKSKTLIGDVYNIIRNTFEHAYAHGIIDRNPALSLVRPSATKQHRRALTDAETKAALEVASTHAHGLLLYLLYYTGMRRGEVLGLRWEDVDFNGKQIFIRRDIDYVTNLPGSVKTDAALRTIPMPDKLYNVLRPLRELPGVYVVQSGSGSWLPQATYKRWWTSLMKAMFDACPEIESRALTTRKAKTDDGKKGTVEVIGSALTPHYFRHNYASVLYDAGVDVLSAQKILGHTDPKTTMSIYTHLSEKRKDEDSQLIRGPRQGMFAKRDS